MPSKPSGPARKRSRKRSARWIEGRITIAAAMIAADPRASLREIARRSRLPKSTLTDRVNRAKAEMLDRIAAQT